MAARRLCPAGGNPLSFPPNGFLLPISPEETGHLGLHLHAQGVTWLPVHGEHRNHQKGACISPSPPPTRSPCAHRRCRVAHSSAGGGGAAPLLPRPAPPPLAQPPWSRAGRRARPSHTLSRGQRFLLYGPFPPTGKPDPYSLHLNKISLTLITSQQIP